MEKARKGFAAGTEIQSGEDTYLILGEFAYGGSALIYRALKNGKENVTLKEIYPSIENGNFGRNQQGQIVSKDRYEGRSDSALFSLERQREQELLERLYEQLEKEEEIGLRLRDDSFLVCNLKTLKNPHLKGKETVLKGLAEMMNMESSGKVLSQYLMELSQKYQGTIPLEISIRMIRQIAETMQKIHHSGYLYCDFSKGNIFLLHETLTAVFIDFGSAMKKITDHVETDQFIPATWGYRAPEIAMQDTEAGKNRVICEASDVYAVMTLFYEVLSGKPFAEDTEFEKTKASRVRDRMVDWKRMQRIGMKNPVAGLILNYILVRGLEGNPNNRISNMQELLELLNHLEFVQKKEDHLYETLEFASAWKYEAHTKMLESFFHAAFPEKRELREALERLGKELQSDFSLETVTYIYTWLEVWVRKLEEQTQEELPTRMRLLLEYSGLAICNHNGQYQKAIQHYKACESMHDKIELSQYLDARLRMAEGYVNFFDYKKAHALISENMRLLEKRKACYQEMAASLGMHTESLTKTAEYGKNASALARYLTFLGSSKIKKAEHYFEAAIDEFEFDEPNRMRVCNAALQMAISGKDIHLFKKYCRLCVGEETLEESILKRLAVPSLNGQEVYNLYALLKAVRAFQKEKGMSVEFWSALKRLARDDQRRTCETHPWELIYRHAAVLLAEHQGAVDETAETLFGMSRSVMKKFQGFSNAIEARELPFDTLFVLHGVTWLQEYRLRIQFEEDEERKKVYEKDLEDGMEQIARYLSTHKCSVVKKAEWEKAESIEERYRLLERCSIYEYA